MDEGPFGICPRMFYVDHCSSFVSSNLRNLWTAFHSDCTTLYPHPQLSCGTHELPATVTASILSMELTLNHGLEKGL